MPDPALHLDADLSDERIVRFAAKYDVLSPDVRAKLAAQIAGDRSSAYYRGMIGGLCIGYQMTEAATFPGSPAQGYVGNFIVYCCKLIVDKERLGDAAGRPAGL